MAKELSRDVFFDKFLKHGNAEDLMDEKVRKWVDKGYLAVKEGNQVYVTKGAKIAQTEG